MQMNSIADNRDLSFFLFLLTIFVDLFIAKNIRHAMKLNLPFVTLLKFDFNLKNM